VYDTILYENEKNFQKCSFYQRDDKTYRFDFDIDFLKDLKVFKFVTNAKLNRKQVPMEFTTETNEEEKDISPSGNVKERNIEVNPPAEHHSSSKKRKICSFCGASDTPMWRKGPSGKGTLCNACGVKWSIKVPHCK
jgi:hypothetical protein